MPPIKHFIAVLYDRTAVHFEPEYSDVGQNYNLSKKEDAKVPQCPPDKEAAIMEALKHFHMV